MTVKAKTIRDVVRMPVEQIAELPQEEKEELLAIVEQSNAKNGQKRAQLIRDLVGNSKKKPKKEPVENSTKTKGPKKPSKGPKKAEQKKAEPKKEEPKKEEPKQKKKPKLKKPDLKNLPEETRKYIEELEEKAITFPEEIEGEKNTYYMQEIESQEQLKKLILSNPYQVYVFVDEFQAEPTQTLALLSNDSVTVLFDQTRHSNTTINLLNKNIDFDAMEITPESKKEGDRNYDFAVYLREQNKK